jgi:flagellar biosynthesis/type III secretory pathway protein FliH
MCCDICNLDIEDEKYIEALGAAIEVVKKAPTALDHIHNVVADNAFGKGYDAGYAEGLERGKADAALSASNLVKRLMANFDDVLSIGDVLEELNILEKTAKGENT